MELKDYNQQNGDLFISVSVIEKISKLASLEVEGVSDVSIANSGVKGIFAKTNLPKAVEVNLYEGVADIKVHLILKYGYKVANVVSAVQESVKNSIQTMTNITVSKVNVVLVGVDAIQPQD